MLGACLIVLLCSALAPTAADLSRLAEVLVVSRSVPGEDDGAAHRQRESQPPNDVDFQQFHRSLGWTLTRGLMSTANLKPLMIGGGGAAIAIPFDDDLSDELRGRFDELGTAGQVIGQPISIAAVTGALVAVAPLTSNRRFRAFAYSLAQAQILDSGLKYALKASVSRTRPNGENNNSFPSGHTSGTFAFATVASQYYGRKIGIPAYTVAALVAAARVESGKHFLSDVIFGATLGYIAGRTATRATERSRDPGRLAVYPVFGVGRTGLLAELRF